MTTAAIICEYNPFHTGHLYQIEQIKNTLHADRIICLMSGDFVERGEPALLPKEIRAEMALKNGADLVLLLPVTYATAAADIFAGAAVKILDGLGCVDYLCFGSECENPSLLLEASEKLYDVANMDNPEIRFLLKEGKTYAEARAALFPEFSDILSAPNNILGIEYLFALKKLNSSIKPYIIERKGAGYNSLSTDNMKFASASGIRALVDADKLNDVLTFIPENVQNSFLESQYIFPADFDMILLDALLREKQPEDFLDVSQDLASRIKNLLPIYKGYDDFCSQLKTRNYTMARIKRALLHIILNLRKGSESAVDRIGKITHVRVLGFSKSHSDIMKMISEKGTIGLITKVPDVYSSLSPFMQEELDRELYASSLYGYVKSCKSGICTTPEYSKTLVFTE